MMLGQDELRVESCDSSIANLLTNHCFPLIRLCRSRSRSGSRQQRRRPSRSRSGSRGESIFQSTDQL